MGLRGKDRKRLLLTLRVAPFVVVGITVGWLFATVYPPRSLASTAVPAPAVSGVVHDVFSRQGLSHAAFHNSAFKLRLAHLVRKSGVVAVVGVEYGVEVMELATAGYEVYAFEALEKFVLRLRKILDSPINKAWKVHLFHAAAGDTSGGKLRLSYSNEKAVEMVTRARVDDKIPLNTEIDVLSADIQGNEYDVLKGAEKILGGSSGVRSLWVEIGGCNPKVNRMFNFLLEKDYIIFDFVPWGLSAQSKITTPVGGVSPGWVYGRPGNHDQYLQWFCDENRKHFTWLQSDIVAIRKDLVTPLLLKKLATIGNDAFVQSADVSRDRLRLEVRRRRSAVSTT